MHGDLGPEHPETLAVRMLRTSVLNHLGRFDEALQEINDRSQDKPPLLTTLRRVRGDEHPDTLATWGFQADCLFRLERYEDPLRETDGLLPIMERVRGNEHHETLALRVLRSMILDKSRLRSLNPTYLPKYV
ncbi:hypothetical protein SAMN05216386_0100 [Nitrosospira briensis]|uniref:Tetratricopeptide repeat-containing protein n=1 Tax=Nitrosospira briensis TaxID=35799 RepID=A0A1I4XG60_9PROT|nr:tetratricopeptide repeat protein [Nitrosospira briensis]SFN24662.1 hypothetical protein SAMN05216386_0100 [Nitrosospira briensis]